jgi:phospholipid/cholesterol/gamma-HCH transport system substrate-binding protein
MQLSIFEKRSLIGIALAFGLFMTAVYQIGKRNLWFEKKTQYRTKVTDADGLRIGGYVTVSGLRVGDIAALEVDEQNDILVTMSIKSSIARRITDGSHVTVFRAFIIGEKRIELIPGDEGGAPLKAGSLLPSRTTTELTDFITGKKLTELMTNVESLIAGMNAMTKEIDSIFARYHEGDFNKAISLVEPSLENFIRLSGDLLVISKELKKQPKDIPQFVASGNSVLKSMQDDLFKDNLVRNLVTNVNQTVMPLASRQAVIGNLLNTLDDLTTQLKKNPDYASKVIEAVTELTITLKALQKTWLLEGKTADVKSGN